MTDKELQEFSQDFLSRLTLPEAKANKPFIVATIGLVGSGRTTVAEKIVERLKGAVLASSNSTRYLLKQAGMPWGENVRQILKVVAVELLNRGYGVVFDGNAADEKDRKNIKDIASQSGASVSYIRINIDSEIAKQREKKKYDNPDWASTFDNFRVNTTEKMLKNIDDRAELHRNIKSSDIPNLIAEIDNNGDSAELNRQVDKIINKL